MHPDIDTVSDGSAGGSTMTFLFTDIEGSTRQWEESAEMFGVVDRHFVVLGEEVAAVGGTVFASLGDGIAAAFRSARSAVRAAVGAQRRLRTLGLDVRMGMHTGEVEVAGTDYRGRSVNRAARVMSAASGGQILVTHVTASLVTSGVPDPTIELIDLGTHRLRGFAEPERLWQIGTPDLPGRFPPLHGERPAVAGLPTHRSSLVGRDEDERRIRAVIERHRIVTLTGVGGVGKTRMAAHLARTLAPAFASTAFTPLAAVSDTGDVAAAIAASFRDVDGWSVVDDAVTADDPSTPTLLVVDNCEHVVDRAAEIVNELTNRFPGLTVLATSREALRIDGEYVVPLRPLAPDAASRLFLERASAAGADVDAFGRASIEAVCLRLDGVPLAIELAAARAASLPVGEILAALDSGESSCVRGRRHGADRHVTLDETIAWSYRLLDASERQLLARLAVFPTGFEVDAVRFLAESIAPRGGVGLAAVESLVNKSMISAELTASGVRYRMLETMRSFALARLDEAGERMPARRAAAEWIASVAGECRGGPCSAAVERAAYRLERDHEAWRDAIMFAAEQRLPTLARDLCGPPANFFLLGRHDMAEMIEPLLDVCHLPDDRRAVLAALIVCAAGVTTPQRLMAWAGEVQRLDDPAPTGIGTLMRWLALAWSGRFADAVEVCVDASRDERLDQPTRDLLVGIAILDHFSLTEARDDRHGLIPRAFEVAERAEMALARVSCLLGLAWAAAASDPVRSLSLVRRGLDDIADVPALTRLTLPGSASRLLSTLDPSVAASALLEQIDASSRDSFADMIPLFYGAALLDRLGDPSAAPTVATVAARRPERAASMMDFVDQARRAARRRDDVALDALEHTVRDGLLAIAATASDVTVGRD